MSTFAVSLQASGTGRWVEEIPTGTVDGVNTVFTLSHVPTIGSLDLVLNISQVNGQDFTIDGLTITFTVAPKPTDLTDFVSGDPVGWVEGIDYWYPNPPWPGWFYARYQY